MNESSAREEASTATRRGSRNETGVSDAGAARADDLSTIYTHVPGILFCLAVEHDGEFRFVSVSDTGLAALGLPRDRVVGALVRDVIPPPSRDVVLSHYQDAIRSGQTVRWREVSEYPAGRKVGEVAVTPIYDSSGVATHLVGVVHDITERHHLEQTLHQREERLAFLLRLNDALRPLSDPVEVQTVTVRLLGEHLGVNRVAYSVIDGDDFIVTADYNHGVAPFRGRRPIADFGAALVEAYRRGESVIVHDVHTDPRLTEAERASLVSHGIAAFVRVMLHKRGRSVASFGVNSATARDWTADERALIEGTAERMWSSAERARTEATLREREQRLRLVLQASAAGSWTRDVSANHVDWDDGFRQLYGFAPDEPSTFDAWLERVHEEDRAIVFGLVDDLRHPTKDAWDVTFRIIRPDGAVHWIQSVGRVERDAAGEVTRLAGLELDVTARRQAETILQAERDEATLRELLQLLETSTQGILSVGADGIIVTANHALETMFGWPRGELIGQPLERLVPSALRSTHARHRAIYDAAPLPRLIGGGLHFVGERKDGSTFPIEVSLNHVVTPEGGRTFAFVTDITERQERTAELEDHMAQLSRLASDLTLAEHHAREQLGKMLHDGLQQLLVIASLRLDQHLKRAHERLAPDDTLITEARQRLDAAIDAARTLSFELSPPVLQHADLPAALTWLAAWTEQRYGLKVSVTADRGAHSERKDLRTLLFESTRELLFNAVKHAHVDHVNLAVTVDRDDELCIAVTDEGVGFDPSSLGNRMKAGAVGWGLFSIRERLALLGGRFEIDSAPGRGTRFRLIAPRTPRSDSKSAPGPQTLMGIDLSSGASAHTETDALRILIVDDHAAVREVYRGMLQQHSELCVVGEATNGLEAIAQAQALRPDVVLMDISMPYMDGIEATQRIRAELSAIQILGLSMQPRTQEPHAIEQAGAAGFFVKGTDTQRLINHLLESHRARALTQ